MTTSQLQITKIDNGWLVAANGDSKPVAFYCEDTFEIYTMLKKFLPVEEPKIITPKR
jgi:hypothetical protein